MPRLWNLATAVGLLTSVAALSTQDIPHDLPVSSLLSSAQSHLSKGETSEALVYYDVAISRDPSNYLTLFKRGATYLSLGRMNQATDDFYKVLNIEPGFEGAHVQLAKIKSKTGDWDAAISEYIAAKKAPDSPEIVELEEAKGAASLAEEASKAGQWEDCVNHAGVAILVAPRLPALRELRSNCRFQRGELEEAMSDLQHILNLRPGDTKPHLLVSATTFYGLGDTDNGIAQMKKCLHSDPESKVCKKLHKKQKAIKKTLDKARAQLQRGQTTTAGRTLVGTSEETGLINDIKEEIRQHKNDGNIPASATSKLYSTVIDLTCQAYTEVCHGQHGPVFMVF
jgi:DnaJ homolog subfamily C member 3